MSISLKASLITTESIYSLELMEEELNFNLNRLSELHPEFSYKIEKNIELKQLKVVSLNLREQKN
jgi:hypothetical protein